MTTKTTTTAMVEPGDWVHMYQPGVWQVYRVLRESHAWDPTGHVRPRTTVFGKRIASRAFKKSFGQSSCNADLVAPLASADNKRLQKMLRDDPLLHAQFDAYAPKPIDAIFNLGVITPPTQSELLARIPITQWYEAHDIGAQMCALGWKLGRPGRTLQFLSPDHTVRDGALVYRFSTILDF